MCPVVVYVDTVSILKTCNVDSIFKNYNTSDEDTDDELVSKSSMTEKVSEYSKHVWCGFA